MSNVTKWYAGLVLGFNDDEKQHRVRVLILCCLLLSDAWQVVYDDGAERVESLESKEWRLASVQLLCEVDGHRTIMNASVMGKAGVVVCLCNCCGCVVVTLCVTEPLSVRSADGTGESDSLSGGVSEGVEEDDDEEEGDDADQAAEGDSQPEPLVQEGELTLCVYCACIDVDACRRSGDCSRAATVE